MHELSRGILFRLVAARRWESRTIALHCFPALITLILITINVTGLLKFAAKLTWIKFDVYEMFTRPITVRVTLTDRLALLTHSVDMRPSFQGLLWDEFDGLSEDKLKILFLMGWWCDEAVAILFLVIGRQIVQVFICNDTRSSDSFHTSHSL